MDELSAAGEAGVGNTMDEGSDVGLPSYAEVHGDWWIEPCSSDSNSRSQKGDSSGTDSDSSSSHCDSVWSETSTVGGSGRPTQPDGFDLGGGTSPSICRDHGGCDASSSGGSNREWTGVGDTWITMQSEAPSFAEATGANFEFFARVAPVAPAVPPGGTSRLHGLCGWPSSAAQPHHCGWSDASCLRGSEGATAEHLQPWQQVPSSSLGPTRVLPTSALPPPLPTVPPPPLCSLAPQPAAPVCCPYCRSTPHTTRPVTNAELTPWKFARYRQRQVARKNNRLAVWFCKYGYVGPSYCKACSEKFCSHLLRQNAKSANRVTGPKGMCSRDNPCESCVMILDNFSVTRVQLFRMYDSRPSTQRQHQVSKRKQNAAQHVGGETSTAAMGRVLTADGSQKQCERPDKKRKSIPGMLAALATILGVWGLVRHANEDGGGTSTTTPLDQSSWKCGAAMSSLVDKALVSSVCAGADPGTLFSCSVNDCAAAGKMPIGERVCRCDGCYKPGRCGGWVLQGHSVGSNVETGRECSRFEVNSPWTHRSRLNWRVPMDLDCAACNQFASQEHALAKCGDTTKNGQTSSCELSSSWAWPQPVAGVEEVVPTYLLNSAPSSLREGVLWSTSREGAAALWLYNIHTPAELVPPGFEEWTEAGSSKGNSSDLHSMWKFEPASGVWLPQNSSIGSAFHPKSLSGAGTWTDKSGSLFIFGGMERWEGAVLGLQSMEMHTAGRMWRYDAYEQKWEPLGPRFEPATEPQDAVYSRQSSKRFSSKDQQVAAQPSGAMSAWPANRVRATIWVDHSLEESTVEAIWMFGGTGDTTTQKCSKPGCTWLPVASGTSELWRYQYEHHARAPDRMSKTLPSATVSGEWQLVSIQEAELRSRDAKHNGSVANIRPTQLCTDPTRPGERGPADYDPDGTRQCPEGRIDAGSWASTSGQPGGWIFGGTVVSDDGGLILTGFDVKTRGQLRDLWQFRATPSAGLSKPMAAVAGIWRQVLPGVKAQQNSIEVWPPAWNGPRGWVDDQGSGSLWITGETGQQHDVIPTCTVHNCSTTTGEVDADSSKLRSDLWRFDVGSERWEHIRANDGFGSPLQTAWHIPHPAKRQRAVLSVPSSKHAGSRAPDTFMLGGIGLKECSDGDDENAWFSDDDGGIVSFADSPSGLTGLWRWEEVVSE